MKQIYARQALLLVFLSVITTLTYGQATITGKILSETKEGLIGATVKVKGTSTGAAADLDGNYKIENAPEGKQVLVYSYVGYSPKEIAVVLTAGENAQNDVVLKEDKLLLNEVVVVGYGTQVKKELTSSIATVKGDDVKDAPAYNFTSALQGKASGVQVTTDNGLAGAATQVRIRGTKTLSNTAEPLYVIDGVQIVAFDISDAGSRLGYNTSPLSSINPADIESYEVLKDAAATAIYGARGANGVIIITTKSGKAGKTKIDVSYSGGVSMPANKIKLLNGSDYLKLHHEAYANDSLEIVKSGGNPKSYTLPGGLSAKDIANTNWIDQMFRLGYYNEANISFSGGDAKTTFYVSGGIRDDKSFIKDNKFQRINLSANISHTASKYFDFGVNTKLTRTTNKYSAAGGSGGLGLAQSSMLPVYALKDSLGRYYDGDAVRSGIQNPLADVELTKNQNESWRTISNVYANINFLKYFTFRNEFGIDFIYQNENFYTPKVLTRDSLATAADRRNFYLTWNYAGSLKFAKDFKQNHHFEMIGVFTATNTKEKYSYVGQRGFPVDSYDEPRGGTYIDGATAGTGREFSFVSVVGRAIYQYKKRHLFQLSLRADASSRFSPTKRWGYFPALSYGWILSDEKFMQKQRVFDLLKFRLSAGTSGNAEFTDDFAYFSSFSGGQNYNNQTGIGPDNTAVKNLTWETTVKSDVGLDFGILKSRLSGSFDFYYEYTYNMLVQGYPLSPSSGYTTVAKNLGKMQNMGVELMLTSNNLGPNSPVQWKTTVTFGLNRNKILDLGGVPEVSGTNYGDNRALVGYPVGTWYLAKYAGIDPQTGYMLIYDDKGNKVIADATSTVKYRQAVGRPYPLFNGGLNNTFSYKGISLDIFLTYSYGNMVYDDAGKRQVGNMGYGFNQYEETLNRWQKPGDQTDVQKLSLIRNYDINTTRDLHDASFLRLRTLSLSYNFPMKIVNQFKARSLRIFVTATNLATATKYKGWDPETNRDKSGPITQGVTYLATPQARTISFGVNVGL
ncbi:MAG: TonB-dependent receptor [Chitinophagales bacterium]